MTTWQRRLIGLGLPCLLAFSLDIGLTLHGQPSAYWAGDYSKTTEGAPFYRKLYAWHPAAAACGHLVWPCLVAGLLVLLPEVLAVVLTIAVVFGHTAGAYTWIVGISYRAYGSAGPTAYQIAHVLFLLAAIEAGVGVRWVVRSSALHGHSETRRLSEVSRWCLVVFIVSIGSVIVFVRW